MKQKNKKKTSKKKQNKKKQRICNRKSKNALKIII